MVQHPRRFGVYDVARMGERGENCTWQPWTRCTALSLQGLVCLHERGTEDGAHA